MKQSKRIAAVAFSAAVVAALVAALPAAAGKKERVGAQINVALATPTAFPANEPFHVVHGWNLGTAESSDYEANGRFLFTLEVDDEAIAADHVERFVDGDRQLRFWVHNFAAGLPAGLHAFTGRWWGPCQGVVDIGYIPGPCERPTEVRLAVGPITHVVTFGTNLALGKAVSTSSEFPGSPATQAVDGNWHAIWNSGGFSPQWIEVDLGAVEEVGRIDLGVAQFPNCETVHRLYGRDDSSSPYTLLREFSGWTVDAQIVRYVAPAPQHLRYVRVETTSSCSWVAWREIGVFAPERS